MNNYRIGKCLKRERKNRQLNQKQFLHGVLSISQYSRIENEEQDIRMMDFIQIMYLNKIDFIRFFDQFQNDNGININSKNKEEKILEKLAQLFYDQAADTQSPPTFAMNIRTEVRMVISSVSRVSEEFKAP